MKTMKNFLSMAALVLMGLAITGCINDDNFQQSNNKVLTLKTTISLDNEGVATRALNVDFGEQKATKIFAAGDQIVVYYKDADNNSRRVVSEALTAPDISADGKTANFTVSFTYTPGNNAQLRYVYPLNMAGESISTNTPISDINTFDYSNLTNQTGDLADLGSKLDLATFDGYFSGTSLPATASLTNRLAILALTFKNSAGSSIITSGLTNVHVIGTHSCVLAPKGGGTFGKDVIYAAIQPETSSTALYINADGGAYRKTLTSRTYLAGNFYNLVLSMAPDYPIALSAVTSAYVGSVITSDGYVYATAADAAAASKTAVAMIAYLDNESNWTNGLAIALTDESNSSQSGAVTICSNKSAVDGNSWRLPSWADWQNIFIACAGSGTKANTMNYTAFKTKLVNAGGTALTLNANYWTSDVSGSQGGKVNFDESNATYGTRNGSYEGKVRAVLALKKPLVYPITLSEVTSAYVGSVITSDGYVYATVSDASAASKTAVAMICYVGAAGSADNSSETYKGLALALADAGTGTWCSQWSTPCLTTQYIIGQHTNDMAGIANTDYLIAHDPDGHGHTAASVARNYAVAHPTGTSAWFLPSAGQWDKMVNACKNVLGTNNNYKDLRDGFSTRGGTILQPTYYWMSTENTVSHAFRFDFSTGNNGNSDRKYLNSCVRSAFAF